MKYAKRSDVPVKRSRAELEALVEKYGATSYVSGWNDKREAFVMFELAGRTLRFTMRPLEEIVKDAGAETQKQKEQVERTAWRGLVLLVKAKLEAVESGLRVFEQEFLSDIVTDGGRTVYEQVLPKLPEGKGPFQLPPSF